MKLAIFRSGRCLLNKSAKSAILMKVVLIPAVCSGKFGFFIDWIRQGGCEMDMFLLLAGGLLIIIVAVIVAVVSSASAAVAASEDISE